MVTATSRCLVIAVSLGVAASPQTAKPARWFRGGIELRGRAEGFTGLGYIPSNDDFYYLSRIRLKATVTATPWPRNAARLHGLHWSLADVAAGLTAQRYFF